MNLQILISSTARKIGEMVPPQMIPCGPHCGRGHCLPHCMHYRVHTFVPPPHHHHHHPPPPPPPHWLPPQHHHPPPPPFHSPPPHHPPHHHHHPFLR
nr:histidine-rich glycoprotein-like [Plodia interpunctella]